MIEKSYLVGSARRNREQAESSVKRLQPNLAVRELRSSVGPLALA